MKDRGRIILISAAVAAIFAGLAARLAILHINPSEHTRARFEKARRIEQTTRAPRGRILDRTGQLLALDISAQHICIDPKFIHEHGDTNAVLDALVRHLPMKERSELRALLHQPDRQYVRVEKYARRSVTEPLRALGLRGLIFEDVAVREYPKGVLGAHVLGFANRQGVGSAGVEQTFDSRLQGSTGLRVSLTDARRREIYSRRTVDIDPQPGADLYLTIDQQIQHFTEQALDELNAAYEPEGAWAIVQNVRTGEILAMASLPTYNPNRYGIAPAEWRRNRALRFGFEPGSTMKAVLLAAALDDGTVSPLDRFDCEDGAWYYGGSPLHDSHPEGILSVADILKKSSNIGAAKIALRMGNQRVYETLRAFGFGQQTGIDLPGEEAGIVWPVRRWSKISVTRLAMGHEVLVTALQMISAFSTIANDGVRLRPLIVSKVVDANGFTVEEARPEPLGRPIRPETARLMRRLLARVTQPGGTGTQAALRGYLVAGKTGTAQKPDLENGGYHADQYFASFVGFLPVENPAISIIVVADNPRGAHYGGTVCAPFFRQIADRTARYLRIPPEGFPTEYIRQPEPNRL